MPEEGKRGFLRPRPLELYHERTRTRGVNRWVYWPARWALKAFILVYFRLRRLGSEHVPTGGVILAANHRSFLDPFVIGCCIGRPIYFVAKQELFKYPLIGWFLNCMGAFPVRRGASDEDSVDTSLALLARGQAVVIFPEGTRIRAGSLAAPKRGVGRLALQSGAPVVPIAITGSERARKGYRIRPVKVHIRCGAPLTFPRVDDPSPFLAGEVTERIWPCVGLQWEWLGGLPPLRTAAVVGAGCMGTAMAHVLARAGLEVQLGCRTAAQAERLAEASENAMYLPGVTLDKAVEPKPVTEIEFAGVDLVVLAVPCSSLPAAVGEIGARMSERSAVLVASKGLVPPLGTTPTAYVAERVPSRAVASLGGPAHAREAIEVGRGGGGGHARPGPAPPAARGARCRRPDGRGHRRRDRRRARGLRQERRRARVGRRRGARRQPGGCRRRAHLLRGARAGRGQRRAQRDLRRAGRRGRPRGHRHRRGQPQPARRRAGGRRGAARPGRGRRRSRPRSRWPPCRCSPRPSPGTGSRRR